MRESVAAVQSNGFTDDGCEFVLGYAVSQRLEVNLPGFFKGFASIADGVACGFCDKVSVAGDSRKRQVLSPTVAFSPHFRTAYSVTPKKSVSW